ncbi:MAG: hypothetical protein IKR25_09215 [Muribaculaceae bacterium]|nr:hypothetical protein [Muribaculaceae bacterium]
MPRYIANYTIVPPGRLLINRITTISENHRLAAIQCANHELAYTTYVSHPLLVVSITDAERLMGTHLQNATDAAHLCRIMQQQSTPFANIHTGDKVAVFKFNFANSRFTRLF